MKNAKSAPKTIENSNVATETKNIPTIETTIEGSFLNLTFKDGRKISLDAATLTDELKNQAMMHGLKQKLVDAAAISRNTETGKSASIDDKYDAVNEVVNRLTVEKSWNKTREGGGGNEGGLLVRALYELYPNLTREQLVSFLESKTPSEKVALRNSSKIAAIIQTYRKSNDDLADKLLADLE
jgi:hypothetical protein